MFKHDICSVLICESASMMFYCSEVSGLMTSDGADTAKSAYHSMGFGNSFTFKFEDPNGRVHRFNCGNYLGENIGKTWSIFVVVFLYVCHNHILCIDTPEPWLCNFYFDSQ